MGALSSGYNDSPTRASRAYDRDRDGFVISGGGGVVVLEELAKTMSCLPSWISSAPLPTQCAEVEQAEEME